MHKRLANKSLPSSPSLRLGRSVDDKHSHSDRPEQAVPLRVHSPGAYGAPLLPLLFAVVVLLVSPVLADPPGTYAPGYDPLPPCAVASITPSETCWVPDLTQVGIEPNPGPVTTTMPSARKRGKKNGKTVVKMVAVPQPVSVKQAVKRAVRQAVGPKQTLGYRVGGWVGDMAQKAIQTITGFGDYAVRGNTLVNGGSPPAFAAGKHMTKVCHREFVANISSVGAAFNLTSYSISPKSSFFPWLSEIALSFEQFAFRGMVVEFKSTSGTSVASTNTALGSVIIATQYNVLAPAFTTQQQMEAYEFCTSCNPSESMIHPIECLPTMNSVTELYMDSGNGGDPRLENLGQTYIATVGQQAASVVGELWVSYEVDLIRPKLFNGVANPGLTTHFQALNVGNSTALFAAPLSFFNGTSPTAGSDLPVTIGSTSGGAYYLQFPGNFYGVVLIFLHLSVNATGSGTLNESGAASILSGAGLVLNPWGSGAALASSSLVAPFTQAFTTGIQGMSQTSLVLCSGSSSAPLQVLIGGWVPGGTPAGTTTANCYVTTLGTAN